MRNGLTFGCAIKIRPIVIPKIMIVCLSYMIVNMGRKIGTLKGFMMLAGSGGALAFITYVFTDNLSVYQSFFPYLRSYKKDRRSLQSSRAQTAEMTMVPDSAIDALHFRFVQEVS